MKDSDKKTQEKIDARNFKVSDYSIFAPKSSRALYVDYPELRQYKQLKDLRSHEILFVWYYACESSPFYHISDDFVRAKKSAEKSCYTGNKLSISGPEFQNLINLKFPPKVERAIPIMIKFKVGPRIRAKMLYEKAFDNIQKILDVDASDETQFLNKDSEVDWTKKKAFVDTISSATKNIPELVKQLEDNFSVSSKSDDENDEDGFDGMSLADEFHEQK